jgi:hypothetical protein
MMIALCMALAAHAQTKAGGISEKMLIQSLREMEGDGIVERNHFREVPPRVEYTLTARGESLRPVLQAMLDWAAQDKSGEPEDSLVSTSDLFRRRDGGCASTKHPLCRARGYVIIFTRWNAKLPEFYPKSCLVRSFWAYCCFWFRSSSFVGGAQARTGACGGAPENAAVSCL